MNDEPCPVTLEGSFKCDFESGHYSPHDWIRVGESTERKILRQILLSVQSNISIGEMPHLPLDVEVAIMRARDLLDPTPIDRDADWSDYVQNVPENWK